MKLNRTGIQDTAAWQGFAELPRFDLAAMTARTQAEPLWLHMGAGNIFRIFPAALQQDLLEAGLSDRGITVCECYDEAILPAVYEPHDNLLLAVTLLADGQTKKRIIASQAEAFTLAQRERLMAVFAAPSLQMVSFTVTEKGYTVRDPSDRNGLIACVAAGLWARYQAGATPLALVSLDNCAQNGDVLKAAVLKVAQIYGEPGFVDYIESTLAFPWTMIDKITPRPAPLVAELLQKAGFADTAIHVTPKDTYVAAFVNAEECQYLVIEDDFPNGRPPLERAGALFTDRETVAKAEKMKVCTCLNPLHTILGTAGCLLGYRTIADCMKDAGLVALIRRAAFVESMPVVVDPQVIRPQAFLQEVLENRFPNPFIPDTPQRIAVDTSQKIPVRFGETLKLRQAAGLPETELEAIPTFFALWLRYLMALDDQGQPMPLDSDPRLDELTAYVQGLRLGQPEAPETLLERFRPLLSDTSLFGVDLCAGEGFLARRTVAPFAELLKGPGAVAKVLSLYLGECR